MKRKGIGYILEAVLAMLILFVFVLGNTVSSPVQDWTSKQNQITANDLSYTLKETGDLQKFIERNELGSLETTISTLTSRDLEASGSIEGLPLNDAYIGFHAPEEDRHRLRMTGDLEDDECYQDNELQELVERAGLDGEEPRIKRSEEPEHETYLYFVDSEPDSSGFDETLWVDNGTRCQFADSDGPIIEDDFFVWGDKNSNYEYYEFKDSSMNDEEFKVHNATEVFKIKQQMEEPLNNIETSQEFETFDFNEKNINEFDLVGLQNNSVEEFNTGTERSELEQFIETKPVLLLADIHDDLDTGFLSDTGLEKIDLEKTGSPGTPRFGVNVYGSEIERYFKGLNGDTDQISVEPQGRISSSNSEGLIEQNPILKDSDMVYDTSEWTVSNNEMESQDPGEIEGVPDSRCVEEYGDEAVSIGDFDFPTSEGIQTRNVISTEMALEGDCGDYRAINIDLEDDGDFSDKGPMLVGESVEIYGIVYSISVPDSETVEFEFSGEETVETVNYRESFEGFSGDRMARIPYKEPYNDHDRKMIVSIIYWLIREDAQFGGDDHEVSSSVAGSIDHKTYMPYRASLRWK